LLRAVAKREKCPVNFVGKVTGNGQVRLLEKGAAPDAKPPVDLDLALVLGKMPPKTFDMKRAKWSRPPLSLPKNLTIQAALDRVLRLPSVASKRWLTNKVNYFYLPMEFEKKNDLKKQNKFLDEIALLSFMNVK
jgi:phosphoribosylformylglycinamidine synthase